MTKEQKLDMFKMRLEGYTYQQIGIKYEISGERVRQILERVIRERQNRRTAKCVYPKISEWCAEHKETMMSFAKRIGMSPCAFYPKIYGQQRFRQDQIDKILAVTGLTYEEAFREEYA
jgi:hypothetical protein